MPSARQQHAQREERVKRKNKTKNKKQKTKNKKQKTKNKKQKGRKEMVQEAIVSQDILGQEATVSQCQGLGACSSQAGWVPRSCACVWVYDCVSRRLQITRVSSLLQAGGGACDKGVHRVPALPSFSMA
jgi:hypothetical protein